MNTAKSMPDLSNTERVQIPRPGSADLLSSENYTPDALSDMCPGGSPPKLEYLTIPIVKGNSGFGFTIADSAYGQKVKKILDKKRCQILAEGDILVDINSINVKGMSHSEVVQVLKDCPQGHEAIVMIQRGGLNSPSKSRNPSVTIAGASGPPGPAAGGILLSRGSKESSPKKQSATSLVSGLFRSKTPTAEMYSSQPKEIIPNRPKTPLVDTRIRSKTPTFFNEQQQQNALDYPFGYNSKQEFMYNNINNNNNYPYYTNTAAMDNNKINGNHSLDQYDPHTSPPPSSYNYPPRSEIYSNYPPPPNQYPYEKDISGGQPPFHKSSMSESYAPPFPYFNNNNNNSQSPNGYIMEDAPHQSYGYVQYPKDGYDVPRQDSGYSSQTQVPPSRNPYPPYYGHNSSVSYNNGNAGGQPSDQPYSQYGPPPSGGQFAGDPTMMMGGVPPPQRRKESTSFEHPVPMPRFHPSGGTPLYEDFTVTLARQESGFGFRIVGGTEEGSQVSIGHIVPGGSADLDGRVMSGDEIVCVDGQMVLGSSHPMFFKKDMLLAF